jgi:O-antigen ligase
MSLLYLLLFLTPFHEDPRLGTVLLRTGFAVITPLKIVGLLAAGATIFVSVPNDAAPRVRTPIVALFLPFAIVPVAATVASGLPNPAAVISELLTAALLFVSIIPTVRNRDRLMKALRSVVLGFAFSTLWVFKGHFSGDPRPGGLEQDANYEALMLLLALPLGVWMALYEERRLWRRVGLVCGALLVISIILGESRGGIIGLGVAGLFAALRSRRKMRGVALLAGAAFAVFALAPNGLVYRFKSIQFTGAPRDSAAGSPVIHAELIRASLIMIEAHPLFGVGLEEFKTVAPKYDPALVKISGRSWVTHDTFLQIGSEAGLPALFLFLAMLWVAWRDCRYAQLSSDPQLTSMARAMEISLVGVSVTACTISVTFLPFCLIILLAHSLREVALAPEPQTRIRPAPTQVSTIAGLPRKVVPARHGATALHSR